jgi:hypothetical protein
MAFRRRELIAAGGFDPALGGGSPAGSGEDIYAFSTAVLRGGQIVYEPRAICWHEHRKDGNDLRRQIFDYGVGFGAILTKAATSEVRFYRAAACAIPLILRKARRRRLAAASGAVADAATMPDDLAPAQRAGILRGPKRYFDGVLRARRLDLRSVIRGG